MKTKEELKQYQCGWYDGWEEGYKCGFEEIPEGCNPWVMFICGMTISYFIFNGGLF